MSDHPSKHRVLGHYRIIQELGRGSQGQVFLAEDVRLQRRAALKVLSGAFAPSPETLRRFQREAAAASRLDHPGICGVYEAGEVAGAHYIAMRFIEGETLARRIDTVREGVPASESAAGGETLASPRPGAAQAPKSAASSNQPSEKSPARGPATPRGRAGVMSVVHLIERAARALHAAHEAGLIHRDVKPGNIMVTPEGDPVILDFGLARDESSEVKTLTHSGDLLGTPAYMSPEQLLAQRVPLDRRTDIYSLGVTLYECLTLKRPFDAPSREGLYQQILAAHLPDPTRSNPSIPRDLRVAIETALDKDRNRRYKTALEFAEDLRRIRCYEPIKARPAGPILRFRRWTQRNPVLATAFFCLAAGLCVSLFFLQQVIQGRGETLAALDLQRRESEAKAQALSAVQTERDAKARALVEKQEALQRAEGNFLIAQAAIALPSNPALSAALAMEGASRQGERQGGLVTANILIQALDALREEWMSDHGASVSSAVFSADGSSVLSVSWLGWQLHETTTGRLLSAGRNPEGQSRGRLSPDGRTVLLAGASFPVASLWEAATGMRLRVLTGHEDSMIQAAFSPEGRRIVTGSTDRTARVWDSLRGELLFTLKEHEGGVGTVSFSPGGDKILTASDGFVYTTVRASGGFRRSIRAVLGDNSVRIWDAKDGRLLQALSGHVGGGVAVFNFDGTRVATASRLPTPFGVRIWDAKTGEVVASMNPSRGYGTANRLAFSPDGGHLLSVANDEPPAGSGQGSHRFHIWDAVSGKLVKTCSGHDGPIQTASFSPASDRIATASSDRTIRIWDSGTGEPVTTLRGHEGPIVDASFSPDGRRILSCSDDGSVRIWNASTRSPFAVELAGRPDKSERIIVSPGGQWAFIPPSAQPGGIWDLSNGRRVAEMAPVEAFAKPFGSFAVGFGPPPPPLGGVFSPDGSRLLTIQGAKSQVIESASGKHIFHLDTADAVVGGFMLASAAFSPDGKSIVTVRDPGVAFVVPVGASARLWSAVDGKLMRTVQLSNLPIRFCEFDAAGDRFLIQSVNGLEGVWETASGEAVYKQADLACRLVRLSPDGRAVALDAWSSDLFFFSLTTRQRQTLRGHSAMLKSLGFGPEGRTVLSASDDHTARIWSVEPPFTSTVLRHLGPVRSIAASRDGRWIVTSSNDGTARIWDAATGKEAVTLPHGRPVAWADFSAAGTEVLTISGPDGEVRRWPLDPLPESRRRIHRKLSPAEMERLEIGTVEERLRFTRTWSMERAIQVVETQAGAVTAGSTDPLDLQELASSLSILVRVFGAPQDDGERVRVLEVVRRAAKSPANRDPSILEALAEAEARCGELPAAILTLERASRLGGAGAAVLRQLDRRRRLFLPDLASFASIDWALDGGDLLIPEAASWRYFRGLREPSPALEWTTIEFADGEWEEGPSGFGYGDGDDTTVLDDMQGRYTTVYIRRSFDLSSPEKIARLLLSVLADDGFVAYVNGSEVGRNLAGAKGTRLPFNAVADREVAEPAMTIEIEVDVSLARPGKNVLAIQGINRQLTSSDFSLLPALTAFVRPQAALSLGRERFDAFRAAASGADIAARLEYIDARLLELEDKSGEAIARYERLLDRKDSTSPEPCLRAAELLRRSSKPERALEVLGKGLAMDAAESDPIWVLWAETVFKDLKMDARGALRTLPRARYESDRGADILWSLEEIDRGGILRINAGGEEYPGAGGVVWSKDRFYRGGASLTYFEIAGAVDAPIHRSQRSFLAERGSPGYAIPVPPGRYRVILHFAEVVQRASGERVFDGSIEGKQVFTEYEPLKAGFAAADQKSFDVEVRDGMLDIEFQARRGIPTVSALSVERQAD